MSTEQTLAALAPDGSPAPETDTAADTAEEIAVQAVETESVEARRLSLKALAEIAAALADVDMRSMPYIPDNAPCRLPGSNPNDWFDPLASLDLHGVDRRFINEVAESLCEDCPVLGACLSWGLANPKQAGILGGTTHKYRLNLIKATKPVRRTANRPAA